MVEVTRKEFKNDLVYSQLYNVIKRNHKIADHTIKTLNRSYDV